MSQFASGGELPGQIRRVLYRWMQGYVLLLSWFRNEESLAEHSIGSETGAAGPVGRGKDPRAGDFRRGLLAVAGTTTPDTGFGRNDLFLCLHLHWLARSTQIIALVNATVVLFLLVQYRSGYLAAISWTDTQTR